jgi:DNA uptake protein ComE-like DNA-binding protein
VFHYKTVRSNAFESGHEFDVAHVLRHPVEWLSTVFRSHSAQTDYWWTRRLQNQMRRRRCGPTGNRTSLEILAGFPRTTQMTLRRLLSVAALLALSAAPALAQTAAPAQPAAPAVAAPAKPATPVAAAPIAKKINLNTATATELDTLPQIGPARAKAIVDARTKSPFKNWDDFVARKVVPANAEAAIKSMVAF